MNTNINHIETMTTITTTTTTFRTLQEVKYLKSMSITTIGLSNQDNIQIEGEESNYALISLRFVILFVKIYRLAGERNDLTSFKNTYLDLSYSEEGNLISGRLF